MRYSRNIPALSEAECALLRTKTVAVIGCGGLGGYLIEFLARLGIGSIRCVDGDTFQESNLNRQLLSTVSLLGVNKAEAAADRVKAINPDVQVTAIPVFLDADNAEDLIKDCDAVFDGLDNIHSRRILAQACRSEKIPYIYGAIAGWVAQAAIYMPEDNWIEKLYPEDVVIKDKSALSFIPALCAAMQVSLCTRVLTGRAVQTGKLHYADLLYEEYEHFPMN
jgi:molybdopterin/thiamine biosynthesis adenylyltransferase